MGLFLKGKVTTAGMTLLAGLLSICMFAFYITLFSQRFDMTGPAGRVLSGFATTFHLLQAIQTVFTTHNVMIGHKKMSFGRWFFLTLTATVFDLVFFFTFLKHSGFRKNCLDYEDKIIDCPRLSALVGLSMAIFFLPLFRIFVALMLWHFDVKNNQSAATSSGGSSNSATPAASSSNTVTGPKPVKVASLPKKSQKPHLVRAGNVSSARERIEERWEMLNADDASASDEDDSSARR
ncbi:hypothetical protein ACM66B_005694 [Microbotryomycetes sp. NB124-2]